MTYRKGQTGNPNGRPKGIPNKRSRLLREAISDFLAENFEKIKIDFNKLARKDRMRLYVDLLPYGLPKLQAAFEELEMEEKEEQLLDVSHLTYEELKKLATICSENPEISKD